MPRKKTPERRGVPEPNAELTGTKGSDPESLALIGEMLNDLTVRCAHDDPDVRDFLNQFARRELDAMLVEDLVADAMRRGAIAVARAWVKTAPIEALRYYAGVDKASTVIQFPTPT